MTDGELNNPNIINVLPYQARDAAISPRSNQSEIQVYKKALGERFAEAETLEEQAALISLSERVQALDIADRRLKYTERAANSQLQETERKASFQRIQQGVASVSSIAIGAFFIQAFPLAGLLFFILGLARPLGYSLGDISDLFNGLKGFPQGPDDSSLDEQGKSYQSEELKDVRF